jgi:hypothetical protein
MPPSAHPLIFDGPDDLTVDDDDASLIMAWAGSLPGWSTGSFTPLRLVEG